MKARIRPEAEEELEAAFHHYESKRAGLGIEMLDEFRRSVEKILQHPNAWRLLEGPYRLHRLRRFPYGIVYKVVEGTNEILILAVHHSSRKPGAWRGRV
jgi:toxin ParE1/3/4